MTYRHLNVLRQGGGKENGANTHTHPAPSSRFWVLHSFSPTHCHNAWHCCPRFPGDKIVSTDEATPCLVMVEAGTGAKSDYIHLFILLQDLKFLMTMAGVEVEKGI